MLRFPYRPSTITALVGVNGAGKSTLFKAIMGFIPVARGEILLLGNDVRDALKSNLVAYVPQAEEVDWAFPRTGRRCGHDGALRSYGFFCVGLLLKIINPLNRRWTGSE